MALSRHDWKIVDWDVKPQHNQLCFTWSGMAFHILDPEYDSELRYSSIFGFSMYSKLSEVDLSDLWRVFDVKVKEHFGDKME